MKVLPALLSALPLTGDPSEGPEVYACVVSLLEGGDASAISLLGQIIQVLLQALSKESTAIEATR